MAFFAAFVEQLLKHGSVVLHARPQVEARDHRYAERLLADVFADYRLEIAGVPIPFDAAAALDAAERLWWALWFLLHHGDAAEEIEKRLPPPQPPLSAAQHLSADLVVRFVPQVHRRAKRAADEVLTKRLEEWLRLYPLSGVLADLEEGPLTPVTLDQHSGLLLLYAERLAERVRPAWVPEGPALASVEMIFAERGLQVPIPLPNRANGNEEMP